MTERLYFTCPIKAFYMHKEFGVKFFTEIKIEANLMADNTVENMTPKITKIYVAPESEYIFEPKEGDLDADGFCFTKGMPVQNHMTGKIDYYTDACWLVKIEEFTRAKEKSKTIFRDNNQFFMPEVKNENN